MTTDIDPRFAELIETAANLLRLSTRLRSEMKRWNHQAFAAEGLHLLYGNTITGFDSAAAVGTSQRLEQSKRRHGYSSRNQVINELNDCGFVHLEKG